MLQFFYLNGHMAAGGPSYLLNSSRVAVQTNGNRTLVTSNQQIITVPLTSEISASWKIPDNITNNKMLSTEISHSSNFKDTRI